MTEAGLNPMLKYESREGRPALGRLILDSVTGMHGEVSKQLADELVELTEQVREMFLTAMQRTQECECLCNAMDALLDASANCGQSQSGADYPDAWDVAHDVLRSVRGK